MYLRITMAGESHEAALARFLGGFKGLDGTAGSENLLDFVQFTDRVNLPKIHVVCFQPLQREMQFILRFLARSLDRLCGDEHLFSKCWQDLSVHLLGAT